MDTSMTSGVSAALSSLQGVEDKKAGIQVAMLRKSLDTQQQMAADLMRLLEGKGQNLDIRA